MFQFLVALIALYLAYRFIFFPAASTTQTAMQRRGQMEQSPLDSMTAAERAKMDQLQQVFPQLSPPHLLHQLRQHGFDMTVDGILTGRIQVPEKPTVPEPSASAEPIKRAKMQRTAAVLPEVSLEQIRKGWQDSADDRHQQFQMKRDYLIQQARRRYMEKHG